MKPSEFNGWDTDDRHKVVMYEIYRSECCPSCGVHPSEAHEFEHHIVSCVSCETKAKGEKELDDKRKTGGYHVPPGTRVGLRRRPPPEQAEGAAGA